MALEFNDFLFSSFDIYLSGIQLVLSEVSIRRRLALLRPQIGILLVQMMNSGFGNGQFFRDTLDLSF